jgi:HSP20 family protein
MAIERFVERRPVYWRPLFGLRGLQDEMNRMFSDFFDETSDTKLSHLAPSLDVVDGKDDIQVHVELPGIAREDVDISLKEDVLTIRGEKKEKKEEKGENRYYVERSYGTFSRTINLPAKVRADQVKASYKDGVLEVSLPKAEGEKTREVHVDVE